LAFVHRLITCSIL